MVSNCVRQHDALIVGGGPAGLSAALILGRCRRRVLICDDGQPRNAVAAHMHGFLSRDGIPPIDFLRIARHQLKPYTTVELSQARVDAVRRQGSGFEVQTADGCAYVGRALLMATGVYDELPAIRGLKQLWGRSVFVCPYCDAWEVADKRIAVTGCGRRAVQLAQELRQWSRDLLICPENSSSLSEEERIWAQHAGATIKDGPIAELRMTGPSTEIIFGDGAVERCDAVFLSAPLRQRHPLVDMIGLKVREDGDIETDARGRTLVHGCYAAGDAAMSLHQVTLAAASGVCAAMAINEDLIAEDVRATILK